MPSKECLTCVFNENPPKELGGLVFETKYWRIEHCVGPVPAGSMVLAHKKHIEFVEELEAPATKELGELIKILAGAMHKVTGADRVYQSLWAEGSRHVHWVFTPVTEELRQEFGLNASELQAAMKKKANYSPDPILASQYSAQIAKALRETWTE